MEEYNNNCTTEVAVLRRKLQSKAEALLILSQELEQCRTERDQLRLIAERAQIRPLSKKTSDDQVARGRLAVYHESSSLNGSSADHYLEAREQNKGLRFEIQDLKQKLREAYGDIKVLRAGVSEGSRPVSMKDVTPAHQREELVEQLEQMSARVTQLEADLRGVLDEKEELVTERESYRAKVQRLNVQLNTVLRGDAATASARLVDIDALLMDNKYLHEQLQQTQAEKELAHQALIKYKSMLERRRSKGIVKLGDHNPTMVVSHKQVQELLERGTEAQMPNTEATLADLKSLCQALLEALQDKTLALTHQRKANKILAGRIDELEHRLVARGPCLPPQNIFTMDRERAALEQLFEETDGKPGLPTSNSSVSDIPSPPAVNGCDTDTNDSLPEDLQEMVNKALKEIREEEESKHS